MTPLLDLETGEDFMKTVWTKLNRLARTAALIALVVGTMGSGGGSCCGQSLPVPPPPLDAVWCDFAAVPCTNQSRNSDMSSPDFLQPNGCLGVPCTTTGGASCDVTDATHTPRGTAPNDFASC